MRLALLLADHAVCPPHFLSSKDNVDQLALVEVLERNVRLALSPLPPVARSSPRLLQHSVSLVLLADHAV